MLKQAKAADDEEDARYDKDNSGDELPEELSRRETRLQRIKEAKKALEQRAREEAQKSQEHNEPEKKAVPEDKAQYNFTDPESRIMKGADGFVQATNRTNTPGSSASRLSVAQLHSDKTQIR